MLHFFNFYNGISIFIDKSDKTDLTFELYNTGLEIDFEKKV